MHMNMNTANPHSEWSPSLEAWTAFTEAHPELGYRPGRWQFHNFLRHYRDHLRSCDAIRLAKNKHWIAHRRRFLEAAFECATGAAGIPA
jgi:hypothetical protein